MCIYYQKMILHGKYSSGNILNLAFLGKQEFSVELSQTIFQELLCYICSKWFARTTHFLVNCFCRLGYDILKFCNIPLQYLTRKKFFWFQKFVDFRLLKNRVLDNNSKNFSNSNKLGKASKLNYEKINEKLI